MSVSAQLVKAEKAGKLVKRQKAPRKGAGTQRLANETEEWFLALLGPFASLREAFIFFTPSERHRRGLMSLSLRFVMFFLVVLLVAVGVSASAETGLKSALSGLKSISNVAPRGECKMLPDTTKGTLSGSMKVPALLRGVGIDQRLNQQVPLNLPFTDASGKQVRLGDYFDGKPVILSLVYFNCPNLCTMVEDDLVQSLRLLKFDVGKQFDVLTVSFDPHDTPQMAADKRAIYLGIYGRKGSQQGWHFLTGDQASITALTDAVGFHFNYDPTTHLYAHAVGVIVLTPQGRISRYFYGLTYPAGDLRLSLVQASNDKIGSPVDRLILYCCSYDPNTGKYDPIISRVLMLGGLVTVLCLGTLIVVMVRGGNQKA